MARTAGIALVLATLGFIATAQAAPVLSEWLAGTLPRAQALASRPGETVASCDGTAMDLLSKFTAAAMAHDAAGIASLFDPAATAVLSTQGCGEVPLPELLRYLNSTVVHAAGALMMYPTVSLSSYSHAAMLLDVAVLVPPASANATAIHTPGELIVIELNAARTAILRYMEFVPPSPLQANNTASVATFVDGIARSWETQNVTLMEEVLAPDCQYSSLACGAKAPWVPWNKSHVVSAAERAYAIQPYQVVVTEASYAACDYAVASFVYYSTLALGPTLVRQFILRDIGIFKLSTAPSGAFQVEEWLEFTRVYGDGQW